MEPTIVPFGGLRPRPGVTHPIVTYLLDLAGKERARIATISTATGDAPEYVAAGFERFPAERAEVRPLRLFNRTVRDIEAFLCSQDIVWVGGGNTVSMLAVWRAHGVDRALRAAWEQGVIMTGGSAGSLCWFEGGTTDSFDLRELAPLSDGLGFLPGTHCPHYDGEEQRRPLYQRLIAEGFPAGYAIDDDAALRFTGTELTEVITAREGATAYRVEPDGNGGAVETTLAARLLT
jgi:dipeptidase E